MGALWPDDMPLLTVSVHPTSVSSFPSSPRSTRENGALSELCTTRREEEKGVQNGDMLHLLARVTRWTGPGRVEREKRREKEIQHSHGFSLVAMTIPSRASVIALILKNLLGRRFFISCPETAGRHPRGRETRNQSKWVRRYPLALQRVQARLNKSVAF